MEIYSSTSYEVSPENMMAVIREQKRRIQRQQNELYRLNMILTINVKKTTVVSAFRFFLVVLFDKTKIWKKMNT